MHQEKKTVDSPLPSKRNLRSSQKITLLSYSSIPTSTAKKSKLLKHDAEINFNLSDTNFSVDNVEKQINPNNKHVQREIGLDSCKNLEFNNDLSFDMSLESSNESCTSDCESDDCSMNQYSRALKSMQTNFDDNSCFIVFWNYLLQLFTHCHLCSNKITSKQHFTQGTHYYQL